MMKEDRDEYEMIQQREAEKIPERRNFWGMYDARRRIRVLGNTPEINVATEDKISDGRVGIKQDMITERRKLGVGVEEEE